MSCECKKNLGVKLAMCEVSPETKQVTVKLNLDTLARLQKIEPNTPIEQLVEQIIESFDW